MLICGKMLKILHYQEQIRQEKNDETNHLMNQKLFHKNQPKNLILIVYVQ